MNSRRFMASGSDKDQTYCFIETIAGTAARRQALPVRAPSLKLGREQDRRAHLSEHSRLWFSIIEKADPGQERETQEGRE